MGHSCLVSMSFAALYTRFLPCLFLIGCSLQGTGGYIAKATGEKIISESTPYKSLDKKTKENLAEIRSHHSRLTVVENDIKYGLANLYSANKASDKELIRTNKRLRSIENTLHEIKGQLKSLVKSKKEKKGAKKKYYVNLENLLNRNAFDRMWFKLEHSLPGHRGRETWQRNGLNPYLFN